MMADDRFTTNEREPAQLISKPLVPDESSTANDRTKTSHSFDRSLFSLSEGGGRFADKSDISVSVETRPPRGFTAKRVQAGPGIRAMARLLSATPVLSEAYSALYGQLRTGSIQAGTKIVLVTSARPSEGKTTLAIGLAMAVARAGQSVLLVDGDLRRPRLSRAACPDNLVGLGEVLDRTANPLEAVCEIDLSEEIPGAASISVITAGQKPPQSLPAIDLVKGKTIFQSLLGQFGMILIDSPSVLAASDALLLAAMVDGVLFVIAPGSDRNEVRRAKHEVEAVGTPLLGAVLNQFDASVRGLSNHPYRGYYAGRRR